MQQNSFDDTIFLGQFCHVNEILIGVSVVLPDDISSRWTAFDA